MAVTEIPLIDISGFETGDEAARRRIAGAVADAVEGIGFLSVTGHGVEPGSMRRIADRFEAFFDLPEAAKRRCTNPARNINRGYVPLGDEFVASAHDAAAPPDYREALAFGRIDLPDDPYYRRPEAGYAYEDNIWPEGVPGLADAVRAYYRALEELNRRLLRIFAAALGIEAQYFLDRFDRHASVLRAINYPDQDRPPAPGQLRCGAHSDFGTHTLLQIDDAPGGLQALARDGSWIDVSPPAGSFVVNIGDLMMVWTNDRWLSNLHRVVNPPCRAQGRHQAPIARLLRPAQLRRPDRVHPDLPGPGRGAAPRPGHRLGAPPRQAQQDRAGQQRLRRGQGRVHRWVQSAILFLPNFRQRARNESGGHGHNAQTAHQNHEGECLAPRSYGIDIAVANGGKCRDRPPQAMKDRAERLGLGFVFEVINSDRGKIENDQRRKGKYQRLFPGV